MIANSYYSQEMHGPYEVHDIGNLELEEGGTLNEAKDALFLFQPGTAAPVRSSNRCTSDRDVRSIRISIL
jgi:hypothetical protein